jgi:hypothetical protein
MVKMQELLLRQKLNTTLKKTTAFNSLSFMFFEWGRQLLTALFFNLRMTASGR